MLFFGNNIGAGRKALVHRAPGESLGISILVGMETLNPCQVGAETIKLHQQQSRSTMKLFTVLLFCAKTIIIGFWKQNTQKAAK